MNSGFDEGLFNFLSILPIIFFCVFGVIFVIVVIFGISMAIKHGKNFTKIQGLGQKFMDNKLKDSNKTNEEDEFVECKYCGMKNKKSATKCNGCNAKL